MFCVKCVTPFCPPLHLWKTRRECRLLECSASTALAPAPLQTELVWWVDRSDGWVDSPCPPHSCGVSDCPLSLPPDWLSRALKRPPVHRPLLLLSALSALVRFPLVTQKSLLCVRWSCGCCIFNGKYLWSIMRRLVDPRRWLIQSGPVIKRTEEVALWMAYLSLRYLSVKEAMLLVC